MDRSADFEMPSPKRIRLEAPEPGPTLDPTTPVEDTDDLYGTPPVQPHSPTRSLHILAPALGRTASPIDEKLFQLPGLGMFNGDPANSLEIPQQQSQFYPPFSEAEQRPSTGNVKDVELEDVQKLQINGRLDAPVNDELMVDIQTIKPKRIFPTASEVMVDGNCTDIAKSEEPVSKADAPFSEDVTHSGSEVAKVVLYWHSSGTVTDNRFWLHGNYSIEDAPSTAPDSNTTRGRTHTEVLQNEDNGQNGDGVQAGLFSGAKPVIKQSEETVPAEPTFEELAETNKDNAQAEFELDSSPFGYDSSSDDSTDTSSSDDSDADDYEMLSPAEQARRLMAEDGGSDDEGKSKGRKVVAEVPRTLNEKLDEFVPKPTVVVTEDMKIEELGPVENTVENLALIRANTSGEYQVLESGSLLCLQDRSVIGVVSETLGRVHQPYYSVRFTNTTAIAEAGIEKNTKIFYVAQHSMTVFTQPLKAFKGSDASNLHDEEVGDDELEFSDDEAEAEHKRQIKQQRMAKRSARDSQPDGFSRGAQQRPGCPGARLNGSSHAVQEHPPKSAEAILNYDDTDSMNIDNNEDQDGPYTPLVRPSNLHEILSGKAPPMEKSARRGNTNKGRGDGRGGNRGRGDNRGRGGNRGVRDSERGGKQTRKDYGHRGGKDQLYGGSSPPTPQANGFSRSQSNGVPPGPRSETIGYQWSTHQGNGFPQPLPQQSPIPSPSYQIQQQPQSHTHAGHSSQYPNPYNQPYFQPPPHQSYPSHFPQQNQYHQPPQPISRQGYSEQYASQPDLSFPPPPQYPPSMPPGAHINPNFFKQQGQSPSPQGWQQEYDQQQQQQAFPARNSTGSAAPLAETTRLQDLLRGLGRGRG